MKREQRVQRKSERDANLMAQQARDGMIRPLESMNRAERRRFERAQRRGKSPEAVYRPKP